jgi:N-acetylglucosamine transport system permease protein
MNTVQPRVQNEPGARLQIQPGRIALNGLLVFWAVLVLVPFVWLIITSFKTDREIFVSPWSLPAVWQFDNFARAWNAAGIGRYLLNSVIVVVPSVALTLFISSLAAYILARFTFPGHRLVYYFFLSGMLFPVFLALVPLFFLVRSLGMLNSYQGLIIVYTAYSLSFTILFLTNFFKTIPTELHEAAIIDGANQFQVYFRIMLPLAQPGLVTMAIFNFLGQWNQFILPLILMTNQERYVLPQGLSFLMFQQQYDSDWSALFAAITIIMLPTLAVYILFQKRIQSGLTAGAVKG